MIDEAKLRAKKAAHEKRRKEIARDLPALKANPDYQSYTRGKAVFEKIESFERELRAADSAVSLIDSQLLDVRAANADPELQAFINECFDDRIKTYAAENTQEATNWLGARSIVSNHAAVERRVQAIDDAIRRVRELQRSLEPIDVHVELAKVRASIPPMSSLSKTEKIEAAAESRA